MLIFTAVVVLYFFFVAKPTDDNKEFTRKLAASFLAGMLPLGLVLIFFLNDKDLSPVVERFGPVKLIIMNLLVLILFLSASAWFAVRVFKNKDL